ncbi:MAG: hypothetical protein JO031_06865 [Ktedonobacteraceae bacterium]|nr:hypothetical protein [Ktedonobacteraceae bacterium]
MKQTMFAQQKQFVKSDPRIKVFSLSLILYWIVCAFTWFLAIVRILTGVGPINAQGQFSSGLFFNTFFLPILWTAVALLYVFTVRSWKRFEQKRQAAAQGDSTLLADEQPVPDAQAVSLPLTIRMRPNRRLQVIVTTTLFFSLLFPFIVGFAFGLLAPATHPAHPIYLGMGVILVILGIWMLVVLLIVGIVYAILYTKAREQVTLTEHGIMVSGITPRLQSIPWSEARLFAITNPANIKRLKDRQPLILEVASEQNIVRWTWLRPQSARLGLAVPMLPPEEYEQQMRSVLSVIMAKTGLPLYDLRKKQELHHSGEELAE